jgi:hypothetical protein
MFKRIGVEEWQSVLTIISFGIFFAVFLLTLIRIWRMPSQFVDRMEHLPLAEDDTHEH